MRTFNLVKSLTRVINNYKGLLILCAITSTFGVESAWGHGGKHYGKAVAIVSSSPAGAGKVYVAKSNSETKNWQASQSVGTFDCGDSNDGPHSYKFYFSAQENTGYTFSGWSMTNNGSIVDNKKENYEVEVNDINSSNYKSEATAKTETRYAVFTAKTYEITLLKNGGDSNGSASVTYDNTSLNSITHATRTGYSLDGYYSGSGSSTKVLNKDGTFAANEVTNYITDGKWSKADKCDLYAHWTINQHTLTWDFGKGGSTSSATYTPTGTYDYNTPITYPADETMSRAGYTFNGWDKTITIMLDENVTITAKWIAHTNTPYKVEHYFQDINGNYPAEPTQTQVLYGTTDTQVTPDYCSDYTGYTPPTKQPVNIKGDGSLVVQYKYTINSYTLTWLGNGGTVNGKEREVQTVKYSSPLSSYTPLDANVMRDGYDFVGWDPEVDPQMPAYNLTYTALWEAKGQDISFVANQSTGSNPSPIQGKVGQPYGTLPQPGSTTFDKPGYSFDGWFTAASGGAKVESTSLVEAGITTLYAHWTPKTYTVTFHPGEGGTVDPISKTVTFDAAYGTLPTPVRNGYVFGGWWTDATGGTEITATTTFNIAGNVDRYAHWTALTVDNNTTPAALTFTEPGEQTVTVNFTVSGGTLDDYTPSVGGSGWSFVSQSISGTTISVVAKFTATQTTPKTNNGTVTLTSKASTASSRTANVSANVTLTPSLTANPSTLDFGTVVRGSGAIKKTIAISGTNVVEWNFAELSAPWSIVKKDNSTIEVIFNPQSETAVGAIEKTFDITYKNAQVPITTNKLTITLKANVTLSEANVTWTGATTYNVEAASINLDNVWQSQNTNSRRYSITFTPDGKSHEGVKKETSLEGSILSFGQAGTAVLTLNQDGTVSHKEVKDAQVTLTIQRIANTITVSPSSFTGLTSGDRKDISFTGSNTEDDFYVSQSSGASGVARYEEATRNTGYVIAMYAEGSATFEVSQDETYKYEGATAFFNVSVAKGQEGTCDVANQSNEVTVQAGSSQSIKIGGENAAGQIQFQARRASYTLGGEPGMSLYQYFDDGSSLLVQTLHDLGKSSSSYGPYTLDKRATSVAFVSDAGRENCYFKKLSITRNTHLSVDKTELTIEKLVTESTKTATFDVTWSRCDPENIQIISNNPKVTVSPSEINVTSSNLSARQTITVTYASDVAETENVTLDIVDPIDHKTIALTVKTSLIAPDINWIVGAIQSRNVSIHKDVVATTVPGLAINFVSLTPDILDFEGDYLKTKTAGQGQIKAMVTGNGVYYKDAEDTYDIEVTNKSVQTITWTQTNINLLATTQTDAIELTATTDAPGLSCTYESSNSSVAAVSQSNGKWYLTVKGEGTAIITVNQGGNETYAAAIPVTKEVLVYDPTEPCPSEYTCVGGDQDETISSSNTKTYEVIRPTQIRFDYQANVGTTTGKTYRMEAFTNGSWIVLWSISSSLNYSKHTVILTRDNGVNEDITQIRFTNTASSGYVLSNVKYTMDHETNFDDVPSSMTFSTTPNTSATPQSFSIGYSNIRLLAALENANTGFSIEYEVNTCGTVGTMPITVNYKAPAIEGTETNVLHIADAQGNQLKAITLTANVTKTKQKVNSSLETSLKGKTFKTTDILTGFTVTTTPNREIGIEDFTYQYDPSNIIVRTGNTITFAGNGTVTMKIIEPGDDVYAADTLVLDNIVVQKVNPTLNIPDQTVSYLSTLTNALLQNSCSATTTFHGALNTPVEGTFTWNDGEKVIESGAGEYSYGVTFTPANTDMYNTITTASCKVKVTSIDPTFTMNDGTINVTVDASNPTTIDLTSLIATLPEKNPMNKSEFTFKNGDQTIEKMFYATAAGEYNLTATSPQTNYYNPASQNFKVTVNKLTPTISGSDVTGKLVEDVFTADYTFVNVSGTPSSSSTDDFYYTINNDVVSYDPANNQITCLKEGTATITFTQKETTQFTAATKLFTITVSKKTTTFTPSWDASQTYSIQVGHSVNVEVTNVENDWGTDFAYTVTPEGIFEVTRNVNTITFTAKKACDNASVQLKQNATVRYSGLDKTYNFVVTRIPNTLAVASTAKTLYVCDTWDNIISGKISGAALQVITDPTSTDIISYNKEANSIEAQDEGKVKITFKQEATDEYEGATKSIDITVLRHRIKLTSSLSGTVTNGQALSQTILTGTKSATTVPTEYTPSKEESIDGRWDWATPEEIISEKTATIQRDYVFTPANPCFQINSVQVTIAINKATPVIKNYPTGTLVMTAEESLNNGVNTASVPEQCWAEVNGVKISGIVAWVEGDEPKLTDAKFGYLSFTPTDKLTYNDAIPQPVSIQVNPIPRSITWDQEGLDQIPADKPFTMTAEASGIASEVKYEIVEGEQGIATIDRDRISFSCHGTVKVMATTILNPNYSQDTTYQTLTAIVVEPELNVTASAITYGATVGSSTLQLGANDPAGTLSWKSEDASKMPDAGTYNYIVSYTPASESECKFKPTTTEVSLTVNKAASLLTWKENITGVLYVGQTVTTYPDSVTTTPSGLAVTFTVPEGSDVITIENNGRTLRADKEGTVEVTPHTEGNSNYAAADGTPKLFTVKATTDPVFTPSWTVGDQPYLMYIDQTETISMLNVSPADDENFTYTVTPADAMQLTRSGDVITLKATKAYDAVTVTLKQTATVTYRAAEKSFSFKTSKITPTIAWNTSVPTTVNAGSGVTITPSFIATDPISGAVIGGVEWTYSITEGGTNAQINANNLIECLHYGAATVKAQMAAKGEKYTAAEGTQVVTFTALTDVITWKGDIPVYAVGETLPGDLASSVSGLTITYSSSDESIVDASLKAIVPGTIVLTASTPGNNFYLHNESTHDIVVKDHRTITWTQDLSAIPAVGTFALTATVDKGLQEEIVYYVDKIEESTGDATVIGHTLTPNCAGKVNIRVTLVPNDLYFATDPMSKEATIVLVEPTLNNVAATPIDVLHPLSESQLSYEGTEGSLVWTDGTVVPPYPGGDYTAHFTPAAPCQYQEKDVDVHVTVNKLIPTITWTCETEYQTDQDSIPLCFVVTSPTGEVLNDIELTYASENEDIATIVKNHAGQWVLHVKSAGNVTITATSTETDIYASEKGSADIHYQKMPDEIVWNGGEPIPSFEANAYIPHGIAQSKNDPNDPNMKVTYTSDNTSVIMIGDDGIIHTVNSGKANLTARTSGNAKFEPAESTMEITVSKRHLQLVWEQVFLNFDESYINTKIELVASVIDPSSEEVKNYPITFSFAATDGNPATITGTTLSIIGYGKGTITAHVTVPTEHKDIYDDIEESKSLRVRQTGEKCNTNILFTESITLNPSHETFILPYYAPGGKVTLFMRRGLILGSSNDRHLWISVSEEPSTEHVNQLADYLYKDIPTSWKDFDYDCSQYPNARYLIFECPLGGLSDKEIYIQNISVTQNSYISSPTTKIDESAFARQHWTDTIILNYSDVSAIQYEMLHSDESEITIEPVEGTEIDNDCGDFGAYKFVLKANWQMAHLDGLKDTIYFSSLTGEELRIPVIVTVQATASYSFTNGERGDGDGKWSTSTNWSYDDLYTHGSIPHEYDKVSIDAPVLIDKEVAVNQISINQDVTIAPNAGLTVWEGGVRGTGKVILQASINPEDAGQAYFRRAPKIQTPVFDNMPNAIVQLATRSTLNTGANKDATWQYIGIPVENLDFNVDYITWLYRWDEQNGWIDYKAISDRAGSAPLKAWEGYAITQYGQPIYEFSGKLLNNNQTITLSRTETQEGMYGNNLFANSYASPIDVKRFTEEDFVGDLDKTFYIFNSGSWNQWDTYKEQIKREKGQTLIAAPGQYIAIPALTAKGLDESFDQTMIAPMQGIYVVANADGAQIKLNYEKHVWNAKPKDSRYSQMNNPARAPKADTIAEDTTAVDSVDLFTLNRRVRMVAYGENSGADFVYVMEHNDYTRHYDNGCDAPKMFADVDGVLSLYTNEENTGLMSVAATNDVNEMFIGFNAGEDVNYKLFITSVIGDDLELMDMQTGDRFALRDSASYEFAATPNSEDPYRFRIFKSEKTPVVPTGWTGLGDKAKIWYNKQVIYISDAAANSTASIYTAAGELLEQVTFNHNTTISTQDIPEGVYTVRVEDSVLKFFVKH